MVYDSNFIGERKVISKILAGDKNLFKDLYHRYKRQLMLTCLRYIPERDLAEDALQEAFISIYKDLNQFDESKSKFITWATRITINKCLKRARKKSVFSRMDSLLELKFKFSVSANAIDQLNLEDLTKIINSLPRGYRHVFNMYVIDGYSHKEIANELNISVSTSKTQLMRAKGLLKNIIKEDDYKLIRNYA